MKKQWIGFHSEAKGHITLDEGAVHALLHGGKSLLPAGVTDVSGQFDAGDVIEVLDEQHTVIGRGVVNYSAKQLSDVIGMNSDEVIKHTKVQRIEVIHRDEWIELHNS